MVFSKVRANSGESVISIDPALNPDLIKGSTGSELVIKLSAVPIHPSLPAKAPLTNVLTNVDGYFVEWQLNPAAIVR